MREAESLEVSNVIMCLSACKHSGSNTNIIGGKFVRTIRFELHIISSHWFGCACDGCGGQ